MIIAQTFDIPASRRLVIDVPQEIPNGAVILTFTPAAARTNSQARDAIERCAGIARRMGCAVSSDDLLAERRRDKELEDIKYRRLFSGSDA
jgi:hypothetical protein